MQPRGERTSIVEGEESQIGQAVEMKWKMASITIRISIFPRDALCRNCKIPQLAVNWRNQALALTNYALLSRGRRLSDEDQAAVWIADVEFGHAVVPVE